MTEEPFTSQLLGNTVEDSTHSKALAISRASGVQAASGKAKPSSQYFKLNRESEMAGSLVITPARPPLLVPQNMAAGEPKHGGGGWWPQAAPHGQAPAPRWHIVTFSRGQHAVHAVGGRCELREAGVPAFQDVGSVNIPATRKRESGPPRTVHLSPWPRCPVSTLDLDRPENQVSEWLSGSPRCQRTRRRVSGAPAFLAHAGCGPAGVVMQQPLPLPRGSSPGSRQGTDPSPSVSSTYGWGVAHHQEGDEGSRRQGGGLPFPARPAGGSGECSGHQPGGHRSPPLLRPGPYGLVSLSRVINPSLHSDTTGCQACRTQRLAALSGRKGCCLREPFQQLGA